jgi:integrase
MPLTDFSVQAVKSTDRPQKVRDGNGLYLYVSPAGTKSWRIDFAFAGKRFTQTLGKYPQLTLSGARTKCAEVKQLLQNGVNPATDKRIQKAVARAKTEDTFRAIGEDWYMAKADIRSRAWREANRLYLNRDLYPVIGYMPIRNIAAEQLLAVLQQSSKERGVKTADRVRQTALQVFEHAILRFKADSNPAAKLKRWTEIPPPKNHPHLAEHEIHEFIDALDSYSGYPTTKLAAKLLLLTFVRKTEILEAVWSEFDLQNAKWLIPAERMKMKDSHVVPLSTQAVESLMQLKMHTGTTGYVFPKNSTLLKPMSRTSLNNMFSNMGDQKYRGRFSPHGIRATASTWLNERGFRHDVIERQLAHSERNTVRASYNHADYLTERRQMMQAWADFLFPPVHSRSPKTAD